MARQPNFDKQDVLSVCRSLRRDGLPLTGYQVQKRLGSGNSATYAKAIADFEASGELVCPERRGDPVAKQLVMQCEKLAQSLQAEAALGVEERIAQCKAETQGALKEKERQLQAREEALQQLSMHLAAQQTESGRLQQETNALSAESHRLQLDLKSSLESLSVERAEKASVQAQLKEAKEKVLQCESALSSAEIRMAVLEERLVDAQRARARAEAEFSTVRQQLSNIMSMVCENFKTQENVSAFTGVQSREQPEGQ